MEQRDVDSRTPKQLVVSNRNRARGAGELNLTPSFYFSQMRSARKERGEEDQNDSEASSIKNAMLKGFHQEREYFGLIKQHIVDTMKENEALDANIQLLQHQSQDYEFQIKKLTDQIDQIGGERFCEMIRCQQQKETLIQQQKNYRNQQDEYEVEYRRQLAEKEDLIQESKELQKAYQVKTDKYYEICDTIHHLQEQNTALKLIEEEYQKYTQELLDQRPALRQQMRVLHNTLQELKGNIRVYCRIRPPLPSDQGPLTTIITQRSSLQIQKRNQPSKFKFDRVFDQNATQQDVFEDISQLVQSALDGYKVCIFAYGQTGSGKTFTMEGPYDEAVNERNKGMIQRSVEQVFAVSQELQRMNWRFRFTASFIEIYNEQVRDLLDNSKKMQAFSTNLLEPTMIEVQCEEELYQLLELARHQRVVGQTMSNSHSSRSHSIFQLKIDVQFPEGQISQGILNLIDLAGSERLKTSQAEGERKQETIAINKSLATLGNVIYAIGNHSKYIPYRDSKLTSILQNCLGGDGKTLMFVNISPLEASIQETVNSLRFAEKVNSCSVNQKQQPGARGAKS